MNVPLATWPPAPAVLSLRCHSGVEGGAVELLPRGVAGIPCVHVCKHLEQCTTHEATEVCHINASQVSSQNVNRL